MITEPYFARYYTATAPIAIELQDNLHWQYLVFVFASLSVYLLEQSHIHRMLQSFQTACSLCPLGREQLVSHFFPVSAVAFEAHILLDIALP